MLNRLFYKKRLQFLWGLMSVLVSTCCTAQISFHHYDHLTTKNGLSANFITALAEDADGFLWIGTREGLNRYDGTEFLKFYTGNDLPSNDVTSICPLPNGQIAVGCGRGFCVLNTRRLTIQSIALPQNKTDHNSNAVNIVSRSKNGDIWVNTLSGMVQYSSGFKLKKHYPFTDSKTHQGAFYVRSLCTEGTSGAWGCTLSKGIMFANEATGKLELKKYTELTGYSLPLQFAQASFSSSRSTGDKHTILLKQAEKTFRIELDNNAAVLSSKLVPFGGSDAELQTFPVNDSLWLVNPFYGPAMLLNPNTEKRSSLFENKVAFTSAPDGQGAVYKATSKGIWCGTRDGLYFFYQLPQGIQRFAAVEKSIGSLPFNSGVLDVVYTGTNRYLVSMVGYGFAWWDGKNELELFQIQSPQLNKYNITVQMEKTGVNDILLHSIYGTGNFHINNKTSALNLPFKAPDKFFPSAQLTCTAPDKTLWAIWKDSLYSISYGANKITSRAIPVENTSSLKYTCIAASNSDVWIGTSKKLVIKYAINKNDFQQLDIPYTKAGVNSEIY